MYNEGKGEMQKENRPTVKAKYRLKATEVEGKRLRRERSLFPVCVGPGEGEWNASLLMAAPGLEGEGGGVGVRVDSVWAEGAGKGCRGRDRLSLSRNV